jgi:hypothetical protein
MAKTFSKIFILLMMSGVTNASASSSSCLESAQSFSKLSIPSKEQLRQYHRIGKQECLHFLQETKNQLYLSNEPIQPNYFMDWSSWAPRPACRGLPMLYQLTGRLPWVFGPKNCSTYSNCWMGILTCSVMPIDLNPVLKIPKEKLALG